ncbi:MAG: O-antigen ligase family protein [Acidobacteriota bacterium]
MTTGSVGGFRRPLAVLAFTALAAVLPFCGDQPGTGGVWLIEIVVVVAVWALLRLPAAGPSLLLRLGAAWVAWTLICTAPHVRWLVDGLGPSSFWTQLEGFASAATPDDMYALRRALDALTGLLLAVGVYRLACRRLTSLAGAARFVAAGAGLVAAYGLGVYLLALAQGRPLDWPVFGPIHLGGAHVTLNSVIFSPRLSSTFGNPGWYAQYIVLTLPILLLARQICPPRGRRWAGAGLCLQGTVLLLTWSRAAWLAAGVGAGLFIWILRPAAARTRSGWRVLAGPAASALALAGIFLAFGQPFARDLTWIRLTGPDGWGERLDLWVEALRGARQAPIFGGGAGGFHRFYTGEVPSWSPAYRPLNGTAHSLWFETLTTSGWPGLLLVLLFSAAGVFLLLHRSRAGSSIRRRPVRAASAAALGGAMVLAVFQHIPYVRVIELLWWMWVGVAAAVIAPRPSRTTAAAASSVALARGVSRPVFRLRRAVTVPRRRLIRIGLALGLALFIGTRIVLAPPTRPGWHAWERDGRGHDFRWSRGTARLPLVVDRSFLHLPLALFRPDLAAHPVTVHLSARAGLGGGPPVTRDVTMDGPDWRVVNMDLSRWRGRRVWLDIEPERGFSPARLWGSDDHRWLGVAVGRPRMSDSAAPPPES